MATLGVSSLIEFPLFEVLVANLPLVSLAPVANLPPVCLIPVVHLDLQISPRIFEKFEITPKQLSETWGKMILEKKPKANNLLTLSLYFQSRQAKASMYNIYMCGTSVVEFIDPLRES